ARKIGAAKSLLSFGERTGYLRFNVGAALPVPPIKNILAERILEEADVIRLIARKTRCCGSATSAGYGSRSYAGCAGGTRNAARRRTWCRRRSATAICGPRRGTRTPGPTCKTETTMQ